MSRIIRATTTDAGVLSQVIAGAFYNLPPSKWLIGDPDVRRQVLPGYFKLLVEHSMAAGVVYTTTDRSAVALWLPIGRRAPQPPARYEARLRAATGRWADRFLAFDAALEHSHPVGIVHHHLAIMAVRPGQQSKGIGTALLRHHHQVLDQAGVPAYLEAADLRSRRLYLRHGYVLRPDAPIRLPDGGPLLWPLWREPRATPDAL